MLTVNAEHHPVMKRLHAPGKKKRGVVVVPRAAWDDWLTCRDPEIAPAVVQEPREVGRLDADGLGNPLLGERSNTLQDHGFQTSHLMLPSAHSIPYDSSQ